MSTTKFEMTMTIEVKDVGDVPADASSLNTTIIKAVKSISDGKVVQVLESYTSQKTFLTIKSTYVPTPIGRG